MYSSSSESRRSMTRCIRLDRPPHQIGVAKISASEVLILPTISGQSSSGPSRKPSPVGIMWSASRIISPWMPYGFMKSRTSWATSPVFEISGERFSDAFRTRTFKGLSAGGIAHSPHGLVLYIGDLLRQLGRIIVSRTGGSHGNRSSAPARERQDPGRVSALGRRDRHRFCRPVGSVRGCNAFGSRRSSVPAFYRRREPRARDLHGRNEGRPVLHFRWRAAAERHRRWCAERRARFARLPGRGEPFGGHHDV